MNQEYKEKLSRQIEKNYSDLEMRIMEDIVRRIKKAGEITSTADWQINRLRILGNSSEDIEKMLKEALNASYPKMFELYDKVIDWEYVRNKDIYEQINAEFIPYEENEELQQITNALIQQTDADLQNITQSLGFYLDYGGGKPVLTPLAAVYQKYLDAACMDIVSGAFDYNSVIRRVASQLANSGLRQIDYASGRANRIDVAARRAVMTGITQLTGKISDMNAEKLGTEYYEVAWHAGARPTHAVWQGRVWSKEQLVTVCGLGTVTGLEGANCYHERYPFIPGISERNWTDEWLERKNREENTPKEFRGKQYTVYEAKQRQRQMETAMRAQREKVQLLKAGNADPDDVMLARAKYQGQLNEYSRFSRKMGLKEERERIYYDRRGRIATNTPKQNAKYSSDMIRNATRDSNQYDRYKSIIGDSVGSLADFRQMKYNNPKEFDILKKKVDTYSEINKKTWLDDFKQKSKDAYDRFANKSIYMSVHALSRLPRLNKSGYPEIEEKDIIDMLRGRPNYSEGEKKLVFFDPERQLVVVKNKETDDIISIVRRKNPKEEWKNV
ncbi:phage minor capsid protein [Sellimonas caecigallum]|uniref:Minor capsid protein n=1 Tax=Sellimonas caecigallum TaxID=2592333 RepID=A0ABS7L649_9FIRM|nr:phage minor capsid protein [Sellimonas caecigallum]MBY0758533.1 minor capsid protein [Sellimonas caecigallum]